MQIYINIYKYIIYNKNFLYTKIEHANILHIDEHFNIIRKISKLFIFLIKNQI